MIIRLQFYDKHISETYTHEIEISKTPAKNHSTSNESKTGPLHLGPQGLNYSAAVLISAD